MDELELIKKELNQQANPEKVPLLQRYFKAYEGGYGQGDQFIGVTVPQTRKIVKAYYQDLTLSQVEMLLQTPVHEYRLSALLILVSKYRKAATEQDKEAIIQLYLKNLAAVNNWDLVDSSAPDLLGAYLYQKPKDLLYELVQTNELWKQRIAIIATYYFIKKGAFEDTLSIAKLLLHNQHDLIHKAVGWMLKEIGKRDFDVAYNFLKAHYKTMPRTMLRFAIEKYATEIRQQFLVYKTA